VSQYSRTTGSSITSYPSAAGNLHSSACFSFFSVTLSMYLISEVYPNPIIYYFPESTIYLGRKLMYLLRVPFLGALSISSLVISTIVQSGRSSGLPSREKSHFCIVLGVISHSGRRLDLAPRTFIATAVPTSAVQ
jgi:hypothetical protein